MPSWNRPVNFRQVRSFTVLHRDGFSGRQLRTAWPKWEKLHVARERSVSQTRSSNARYLSQRSRARTFGHLPRALLLQDNDIDRQVAIAAIAIITGIRQLRDVSGDPSGPVFGKQLGDRSPARLFLVIERPAAARCDRARPPQCQYIAYGRPLGVVAWIAKAHLPGTMPPSGGIRQCGGLSGT